MLDGRAYLEMTGKEGDLSENHPGGCWCDESSATYLTLCVGVGNLCEGVVKRDHTRAEDDKLCRKVTYIKVVDGYVTLEVHEGDDSLLCGFWEAELQTNHCLYGS